MESINSIELKGIVGMASVNRVGDTRNCRFSLVTETSYKAADGTPVVDTTWFNVIAWEGKGTPDLDRIKKGEVAHVHGRVRAYRFTTADGTDRQGWEIIAQSVEVSDQD